MQRTKQSQADGKRPVSIVATIGFIVVSLLFVYAAIRVTGRALERQFPGTDAALEPSPTAAEGTPGPAATPEPRPTDADMVVAIVTPPADPAQPSPSSNPLPMQTETGEGTPPQSPVPSAPPAEKKRYTAAFEDGRMDVVIAMTGDDGTVDCLAVLALRGERATLLAIPANCQTGEGRLLSGAEAGTLLPEMEALLSVSHTKYAVLRRSAAADCADAVGPLTIDGKSYDGAGLLSYLEGQGSDELLRAERFARILEALADRLGGLSIFRMLAAKGALQAAVRTNLRDAEGWMLYNAVKSLGNNAVSRQTLPVDSIQAGGGRCYAPDPELTEKIIKKLYNS